MAYASAESGGYGDASVIQFDPAHAEHIKVPDAELLFRGEYQRLGSDLVLTGPDGRHHIIPSYFSSEQHPALVAPNGASLAPDVIDLLAGSPTPGQYAQAQPTTPPDAIGKVEKVIGSVTVIRNGVAVALHVGDAVYKSDVVQTGANSSVGIGFPDGTALNLVANTRMALNDYSFDASGTANSALFTLVEGTFAFVAGKVAHDGNMKVATPVATMGIRGTTVYFATVTSSLGEVQYLAQLFADYQTGHVGAVEWFDNNPASSTYGQLIDSITDTGYAHYFTPVVGQAPNVSVQPATASQLQNEMLIINDLFRVLQQINNPSPSTTPGGGSSTLPDIDVPHVIQPNGGNNTGPFTFNFFVPGLTVPTIVTVVVIETNTQQLPTSQPITNTQSNTTPPSPPPGTIVWTASSGGDWNTGPNWQGGSVPGGTNNVSIPVPIVVNVHDTQGASNLILGPGAELLITGNGALTLANGLDDFGVVQVGGGDPPVLTVSGPVTIEAFALLEAFGVGTQIQLSNVTLSNLGIIEASELANITITLKGDSSNSGTIEAFNGGGITLTENGHGFGNHGLIEALDGGGISITGGVTNFAGATIEAVGPNAVIDISNGTIDNQGGAGIEASHRGSITFDTETITNDAGARIEAAHLGKITFDIGSVTNDGTIEAKHYGSMFFEGSVFVKNNSDGTIEATKYGSITLDGGDGSNGASGENDGGTILAKDHGTITFENIGFTNQDGGIIEAKDAGTIIIEGALGGPALFNDEGTIKAIGLGSTVQIINNATVHGGSFDLEGGALFVDGSSNLTGSVNVSIGGGGFAGFGSAIGADVNLTFTGMGTLELDQPPTAIIVNGFGIGDAIDLTNISFNGNVTGSWVDNTLTVFVDDTPMESFNVEGSGSVTLASDAFGGTEVFFGDDVWTNTAGGDWTQTDGSNWNDGFGHAPNPTTDAVIGASGVYTVTIVPVGNDESREVKAGSLAITDAGATLTGAGTLTVTTTLDNAGIIQPDGCLTIDVGSFDQAGTFINEYSGRIQSLDGNSLTINQESADGSSINYGLFNAAGGNITLDREGSATNHGVLEATAGGTLTIHNHSVATNDGIIQSLGDGSQVILYNNFADANANDGTMKAADGGSIAIYVSPSEETGGGNFGKMEAVDGGTFSVFGDMFNAAGATVKAVGYGSQFEFSPNNDFDDDNVVTNEGNILAAYNGKVAFDGVQVFNYDPHTDENPGTIEAANRGIICFDNATLNNGNGGTVEALGWGSKIAIVDESVVTNGTLTADGGTLFIGGDSTLTDVTVAITDGGIADFGGALTQGVTFTGAGTLALEQAPGEGAAVTGFGTNDVLDLTYIDVPPGCLSLSWVQNGASGTLTISQDGEPDAVITLNGTYDQNNFTILTDPQGNTEVVYGIVAQWTGGTSNQWNAAANWSNDVVPDASSTAIIPETGHQPVMVTDTEAVADLIVGPGTSLEIGNGGALTVANAVDVANDGLIDVNATGSDPLLVIDGPVRVEDGAQIDAAGSGATVALFDDQVGNAGNLTAESQGTMLFQGSVVDNQDGGRITADNLGVVSFADATVTNEDGGTIAATDGGVVQFDPTAVTNQGQIEADGGTVSFDGSRVDNHGGTIQAGEDSVVELAKATIAGGDISGDGAVHVSDSSTIKDCAAVSVAQINVDDGKTLTLDHASIDGSTINLGHAAPGQGPSFTEISVPDVNAIGPAISADGEFVAFIASTNLPGQGGDLNAVAIELYDAATGKLTDISAAAPALPAGETSLGFNNVPSISADGRYVVFDEKYQTTQGGNSEVLLYDRQSQTATVVQNFAGHAEISGDGQYIAMQANSIPGDNNSFGESVLVTDRSGNVLTTISGDPNAPLPPDNSDNFGLPNSVNDPTISSDGRYVTFWTTASEIEINGTLVQTGNNTGNDEQIGNAEVYLYDRLKGTLHMVSVTPEGAPGDATAASLKAQNDSDWPASMSADGHYIVFSSTTSNLADGVGDATNHLVSNIFLYDTQTGTITAITHADGSSITGDSIRPEISADGTHVTFASDESDLPGATDANGVAQTYSYDIQTQTTELVSGLGDQNPANAESDLASAVSANGSAIAFGSLADNLVIPTANDGSANIYLAAPGTLDVAGDSTIGGGATIKDGTAIVENGVTLTLGDATLNGTFVHVGADATLHVDGFDTIATFDGVEVFNEGTVQVDNDEQPTTLIGTDGTTITGGTLSIGASGLVESGAGTGALGLVLDDVTVWNCGTLEANGATLYVGSTSTINGNGSVVITGDGLAHFADFFNQDVTFAGAGTLRLDQSVVYDNDHNLTGFYSGTISGFGAGDTIDLTALTYSCTETDVWNSDTHILTISNGTQTEQLSLAGSYTQDDFALAKDSGGGTEVVWSPTQVALSGIDNNGNAEEGRLVTATPSADNLGDVTYTWLVDGQDVQDGSSNAYTPAAGDVGKTLDVLVSFADPVTNSVEHVTALGGTVDPPPDLTVTGTSATGSVPSSALTAAAASYLTADHNLINTLGGSTGFGTAVLFDGEDQRSDDGSSSAIDITPIFGSDGLNLFGHQYTSLYINNNGNITFQGPNSAFTPSQIAGGEGNPIIAPFWADVDTRGGIGTATPGGNSTGSNLVYESFDTTNDVLTVTWDDVGYYDAHTNLLDAFQLQLISLGNDDFDIVFRYENINWTTGDFSGGVDGLGGTPARAGYSAGDGDPSHYFELSGAGNQSSMLALPSTTGNTGIQGVYVFQVESGAVTSAPVANGAIQFSDSDTSETNTASYVALNGGAGYLGTFSLDPVSETGGTGSVAWHFALASNEVQQFFSPSGGSPITQAYDVTIAGDHGGSTIERVSLTVGTAADDVFDFNPGIGQDLVFEFSNQSGAADKIELSNFGFTDFSQLQLQSINNGGDTLISNLGGGDSITLVGVNVADLQSSDFIFNNDPGGDPVVVPGTSNVIGNIDFAAPNPADSLTASVTPQGSDYVGTFTLDPLTKSNGAASLGFHFDLGNDQINLAPGQTLTQSYGVTVADAQNPAMNVSQTVSVTVGGPGNDNFVFKPGIGLDTIVNFDPTHDTIELDNFANAQTVQQLESLITSDAHGDAVIALGHHDSITIANVTAAQVQQLAQSGHVIMH